MQQWLVKKQVVMHERLSITNDKGLNYITIWLGNNDMTTINMLIITVYYKKYSRTFHICKATYCKTHTTLTILYKVVLFELTDQVTECHSLTVLSPSRAPDAMMFSDGWHAVHSTTSAWKN